MMEGDISLDLADDLTARARSQASQDDGLADFAAAVLAGLARPPRSIPCRFFYDATGLGAVRGDHRA